MEKRYAMRRKTEKGFEYATFMSWLGPVVPRVDDKYWSEDVQNATLLRPLHLNAERKGRTTQSLIEEHLPEIELVEVVVSLKESDPSFERGDLVSWVNVNEHFHEYGTVVKMVDDPNDEKLKVFFVDDYGSEEFLYEDDLTLMCKANHRMDDWQSILRESEKKEKERQEKAKKNEEIWKQLNNIE